MGKRSSLSSWAILGCALIAVCSGAQQDSAALSSRFEPRCLLELQPRDFEPWSLEPAAELTDQHAAAHGWAATPDDCDLVTAATGASCPQWVLARIVEREPPAGEGGAAAADLARILARNGRAEVALALLDRRLDPARGGGPSSRLSECAARIAADAGLWERALAYEPDWIAPTGCGNCEGAVEQRKQRVRARCFVALDRHAELAELCRTNLESEFTGNLAFVELWIDSLLEQRRVADADAALSSILEQV